MISVSKKSITLLIIKIAFEEEMLGGFSLDTIVTNRIRNYIIITEVGIQTATSMSYSCKGNVRFLLTYLYIIHYLVFNFLHIRFKLTK